MSANSDVSAPLIRLSGIDVAYGSLQVLWGVNVEVARGEVVALLGANGAGKSTVMAAISGLVRPFSGKLFFDGRDITGTSPQQRLELGISHVLERQRVFPFMSVFENLKMGAYLRQARRQREESLEYVYELFPFLRDRTEQRAGSLSGGEQQMLVIARGLMSKPNVLMMDEPFLGLAPAMVGKIIEVIRQLKSHGLTIVFIEQHVRHSLSLADRAYVLEAGRVVLSGDAKELLESGQVTNVYMGLEANVGKEK